MPVNGIALASVGLGVVFVYSGAKGFSVLKAGQNVVRGQSPNASQTEASLTAASTPLTVAGAPGEVGQTESEVANDALKYNGHPYLYGGAPGTDGTNPWDCSSFVNWVLGHDLGYMLPGEDSQYTGATHGPDTLEYLVWSGAKTVGHTASSAIAGDLCCWQTHIGIAIGNGEMISAQDPKDGTGVSNIFLPGEILFVRRIVLE
jgi:cell wall-associated NlpC family hydrolase